MAGLAGELTLASILRSGQEENVLSENLVFLRMKQISDIANGLCLKNVPTERSRQCLFPKYHVCKTSQLTIACSVPDPFPSQDATHFPSKQGGISFDHLLSTDNPKRCSFLKASSGLFPALSTKAKNAAYDFLPISTSKAFL